MDGGTRPKVKRCRVIYRQDKNHLADDCYIGSANGSSGMVPNGDWFYRFSGGGRAHTLVDGYLPARCVPILLGKRGQKISVLLVLATQLATNTKIII